MTSARTKLHPLNEWRRSQTPRVTLVELAGEMGVSYPHLSLIERWARQPSLGLANKLSTATGIPINKFIRPERSRCA